MNELNIPEHWGESKLDILEVTTGNTPKKRNGVPLCLNFYKPGDFNNSSSDDIESTEEKTYDDFSFRRVKSNSVMVVCIGATIGKVGIAKYEGAFNQQINAIAPSKYLDSFFLASFFKSPYFKELLWSGASGTTMPLVNKSVFSSFRFPIPPIKEQIRIAEKIKACFLKIDETVKALNDIEATISKLSRSFLMKSGELLEPINLREITFERVDKIGIKSPKLRKIGVDNKLGVVDLRVTGLNTFEKYKIVRRGDILYNPMRANVGSLALYLDEEDAITSPDYVVFSVNEGASKWLVFKFLKSSSGQIEIAKKLKGSVRERLYYDKLADINFSCPLPDTSLKADKFLDMLNVSIQQNRHTLDKLISGTRDSILTKAFEGLLVPRIEEEGSGQEILAKILDAKLGIQVENKPKKIKTVANKKKAQK